MIDLLAAHLALRNRALGTVVSRTPFTRASIATYVDAAGTVATAAIDEPRDAHHVAGVLLPRLIEGAATNVALQSNDLTQPPWSGAATTARDAVGIDGTPNSATTVTDDSALGFENRSQNIDVPDDGATHAAQIWIAKDNDETRFPQVGATLTGGGSAVQRRASLNTKTGEFVAANSLGTGTLAVSAIGNWWVIDVALTNNSSGNTIFQVTVYAAARSLIAGPDTVAAVGAVVVGHVQVELNRTICSSPIFTTTGPVSRAADVDAMLSATATGYARTNGSFIADGLAVGMEITPVGFPANPVDVLTAVTANTITTKNAHAAQAAAAGRSITVGFPALRSFENAALTRVAGRPYAEEDFVPGTHEVLSAPASSGEVEETGLYVLKVYGLQNTGVSALRKYGEALRTRFAPGTKLVAGSHVVRMPTRPAVQTGQIIPLEQWAALVIRIPWVAHSNNTVAA